MDVTRALSIAQGELKNYNLEGECLSLYDGSDFINLTKLIELVLQKEREKNARIESLQKPTFGRWIWRTWKNIGEWILHSEKSETTIRGYEGEGTIETSQKRYILGPLNPILGYRGFEIESTWAKSTVAEVVRDLNKEEWDWVEMKLEEVEALEFGEPVHNFSSKKVLI